MVSCKTILLFGILIAVTFLLTTSVTAVVYDDFQNHPSNSLSSPEERFGVVWSKGVDGSVGHDICITSCDDMGRMVGKVNVWGYAKSGSGYMHLKEPEATSNYWFLYAKANGYGSRSYKVSFYNKTGVFLCEKSFNDFDWSLLEFVISGSDLHLYIDGEYQGIVSSLSQEDIPSYIRLTCSVGSSSGGTMLVDMLGAGAGIVVETIPHNWYVLRHWDAPEASGVYDADGNKKGMTLQIRLLNPYLVEKCDSLQIRHLESGRVIKTESITEQGYHEFNYNISTLLFRDNPEDDEYGLYVAEAVKNGETIGYDYFFFTYDSISKPVGSVKFGKEEYVCGEEMSVTTNLSSPDFSNYEYEVVVLNGVGEEVESWKVTKESDTHTFQTYCGQWRTGTYFAILKVRDKNTGIENEIAFDTTRLAEEVCVRGKAYDAKSGSVLSGVYVNMLQNGVSHEATTDSEGEYEIGDLEVDMEVEVQVAKENYVHENYTFTPIQAGIYNINLYLLPDKSHIGVSPPAIIGVLRDDMLHQAVSNTEVRVWNDYGWSENATTSATGYFEFDVSNGIHISSVENESFSATNYSEWVSLNNSHLVEGSEVVRNATNASIVYVRGVDYEINYTSGEIMLLSGGNMTTNTTYYISYEKYDATTFHLKATTNETSSDVYNVTMNVSEVRYVWMEMPVLYDLYVYARDAKTHASILEFSAKLEDGEWKESENGFVHYRLEYGVYKLEVNAEGYYPLVEYIAVTNNTKRTLYLIPLEGELEQGVGVSYPPHKVEFTCVDMFGNPLPNVHVEVAPVSTTAGSWDWLLALFGVRNETATYYTNQTLNGTTDSRGAITFVVLENVEYEVRFVNESLGINKTIRIYPKADHYTVILTPTTSSIVSSEDYITFNLSYEIIDDEINLSLTYDDALGQTQNLTFFVYNSTTLLYSQNFTNTSNITVSYTVPYKAGEEYMWGYSAFHSRFGEMGRSRILRIAWFLDLGISRAYCTWIAIAIILFLTGMFSFTTVKFGYVVIPMVSLIFAYIGWLPNISIIIIALCLGILAYMSKREKEVGV